MKYQVGPFQLPAGQNIIICKNQPQSIRPETLELLLHFIARPPHVIFKQTLFGEVWKSVGA